MVIWLYCFLGFGATSGASGRIALTIGATVTTRAAELLKLQEQLFLNPVPSGYPNPTRYPVFLSIPDPT